MGDHWHFLFWSKTCIIFRSQIIHLTHYEVHTMTKKANNEAANEAEVVEVETAETDQQTKDKSEKNAEIFSRVFYTLLFFFIGWVTLWVFFFVVLIQFGFLLITGQVNTNLKGFNTEVGAFIFDMIKYLSFQTNNKPFPFRDWPYDENTKDENKSELNDSEPVEVGK